MIVTQNLHTDRLEKKYGIVHAEVIEHTARRRQCKIIDANGKLQTYAITFFEDSLNEPEIEERIRQGGLIGKTLREKGYEIRKSKLDEYNLPLSKRIQEMFKVSKGRSRVKIYDFYAMKEKPLLYGTIVEIYSPEQEESKKIQASNMASKILRKYGFTNQEIWEALGNGKILESLETKTESEYHISQIRKEIQGLI